MVASTPQLAPDEEPSPGPVPPHEAAAYIYLLTQDLAAIAQAAPLPDLAKALEQAARLARAALAEPIADAAPQRPDEA